MGGIAGQERPSLSYGEAQPSMLLPGPTVSPGFGAICGFFDAELHFRFSKLQYPTLNTPHNIESGKTLLILSFWG
jgi:hypothetical protein